jgi:hypothetical protein
LGPASTATSGVPISANPKPDTACAAAASAITPNTPTQTHGMPASSQAGGAGTLPPMLVVKALLVDFDGTACLQDVSEMLLDTFGEPGWDRFDDAVDRGEMGLRDAGEHQVAMLRGARDQMLAFALEHAELAPTFAPFVGWARERGLPLTLASDGFALVEICERDGVPYRPWETFDDVRTALETANAIPGPIGPERCPGWRIS